MSDQRLNKVNMKSEQHKSTNCANKLFNTIKRKMVDTEPITRKTTKIKTTINMYKIYRVFNVVIHNICPLSTEGERSILKQSKCICICICKIDCKKCKNIIKQCICMLYTSNHTVKLKSMQKS